MGGFNVTALNAQLRRMGQTVSWLRASKCPCVDPDSGGASMSCPVCKARGVFWAAGVTCRAGLSGQKVQREWANFGQWESGDVVVSVGSDQALYAAGEGDRVIFTQSSEPFDFVRLREIPILDPVVSIDRCFWLNDAGSAVVEGGIPVAGTDGLLTWPTGQLAPPAGRSYTLRGRRHPSYFVWGSFPQDRAHYDGQALPRRVVLRKFSLFGAGAP